MTSPKVLSLQGVISYCYDPVSGDDPNKNAAILPYALSIKKDSKGKINADFHIDLEKNTTLLTMALGMIFDNSGLSSSNRLGVSYYGDDNIYVYGMTDDTLSYYKEFSLTNQVVPYIATTLVSLISSTSSSSSIISTDQILEVLKGGAVAIDFSAYATLINAVLAYSENSYSGINVYSSYYATIQKFVNSLNDKAMNAIKDKYGEDSTKYFMASSIIPHLFPSSINDIRFTATLKEDGTFDSCYLSIKDTRNVKVDQVDTPITYTYLGITYSQKDLAENYFTTLSASLTQGKADQEKLDKAILLKQTAQTALKGCPLIMDKSKITESTSLDKAYSVYDGLNFNTSFKYDLTSYLDYVNELNDSTSDNYVSNTILKESANLTDLKAYAGFQVSLYDDTDLHVLPDMYLAKSGDKFLLHSFNAAGDSKVTDPLTDVKFAFKTSAGKTVDAALATYDSATQTINILSTPTADTTLVLTCSSGSYARVTYRLVLKAA